MSFIDIGKIEQLIKNSYSHNLPLKGDSVDNLLEAKIDNNRRALGLYSSSNDLLANPDGIGNNRFSTGGLSQTLQQAVKGAITAAVDQNLLQKAIDHWAHGHAPVTAADFIEVSIQTGVPVDLMLAQAVQESLVGTSGGRPTATKNIFNVGNVDNGNNRYMSTWKEGMIIYANLIKREYAPDPNNITAENIVLPRFVRMKNGTKTGDRYAADLNYEQVVMRAVYKIRSILGGK